MHGKIVSVVFIVLMLAGVLMTTVFPPDIESISKENRNLTNIPELNKNNIFSGEFSSQFEKYINDRVCCRGFFTNKSSEILSKKGIDVNIGRLIPYKKYITKEEVVDASLLYYNDSITEIYKNNQDNVNTYIDILNMYAVKLQNINLYSMIIPTKFEFLPDIYTNMGDSQKAVIENIYSNIDKRYKTVDVYSQMQNHSEEYIYFRTDHHWTAKGAYYGYKVFCESADLTAVDINKYNIDNAGNFLGSLYNQSLLKEIENKPDIVEWYRLNEKNNITANIVSMDNNEISTSTNDMFDDGKKNNYLFFMGGDHPYTEVINNKKKDARTLLMIKDSYANAFIPWLSQNYYKIIVVDPRYYWTNIDDILKENHIDDFLMLNYVDTTSSLEFCQKLKEIS